MQDYDNADLGMGIILLMVVAGLVAISLGADPQTVGFVGMGISAVAGIARPKNGQ